MIILKFNLLLESPENENLFSVPGHTTENMVREEIFQFL